MSQEKPLTGQQEAAAVLVAEDDKSDEAIAEEIGITRRQLARWKLLPLFQARVQQHIDEAARHLQKFAIARKDRRMAEYNRRWQALIRVREERAADEDMGDIPGATTGLIVTRMKVIGGGENAQVVREYEVDTGTLNEQLKLEKQAAQEAGQWTDKTDLTSNGDALPAAVHIYELPAKAPAPDPESE